MAKKKTHLFRINFEEAFRNLGDPKREFSSSLKRNWVNGSCIADAWESRVSTVVEKGTKSWQKVLID